MSDGHWFQKPKHSGNRKGPNLWFRTLDVRAFTCSEISPMSSGESENKKRRIEEREKVISKP